MTAKFLASTICDCVRENRYVIGLHAAERLEERGILEWQVVEAMAQAELLRERLDGDPHPVAEFEVLLPDGTPAKVAWAYLSVSGYAKLVTVFFL
jgi:hypothetical protein